MSLLSISAYLTIIFALAAFLVWWILVLGRSLQLLGVGFGEQKKEISQDEQTRRINLVKGFLLCSGLSAAFTIGAWSGIKPIDTSYLAIEAGNIDVFPYDSKDQKQNGYTYFKIQSFAKENQIINRYILDYWIDPQKDGWVGFALVPEKPLDIQEYKNIHFNCKLDKTVHSIWIQISSESVDKRVEIGKGGYGALVASEQEIIIPLSAFTNIDWSAITAINFVVDSYMVPDSGLHEFSIGKIEFTK